MEETPMQIELTSSIERDNNLEASLFFFTNPELLNNSCHRNIFDRTGMMDDSQQWNGIKHMEDPNYSHLGGKKGNHPPWS